MLEPAWILVNARGVVRLQGGSRSTSRQASAGVRNLAPPVSTPPPAETARIFPSDIEAQCKKLWLMWAGRSPHQVPFLASERRAQFTASSASFGFEFRTERQSRVILARRVRGRGGAYSSAKAAAACPAP